MSEGERAVYRFESRVVELIFLVNVWNEPVSTNKNRASDQFIVHDVSNQQSTSRREPRKEREKGKKSLRIRNQFLIFFPILFIFPRTPRVVPTVPM